MFHVYNFQYQSRIGMGILMQSANILITSVKITKQIYKQSFSTTKDNFKFLDICCVVKMQIQIIFQIYIYILDQAKRILLGSVHLHSRKICRLRPSHSNNFCVLQKFKCVELFSNEKKKNERRKKKVSLFSWSDFT